MFRVLLFAGTTEGRLISEHLDKIGVRHLVCVATSYGKKGLEDSTNRKVYDARLDLVQMQALIKKGGFELVVDATHPYAKEVTGNIEAACAATGCKRMRVVRESGEIADGADVVYVESVAKAVEFLGTTTGNILTVTGSKELAAFTKLPDYRSRVFARVLSTAQVAEQCSQLGFEGENLICMQGPFGEELNIALLKHVNASYMVTKDGGTTGGFEDKVRAAIKAGVKLVVIGRPAEKEKGYSYRESILLLNRQFGNEEKRKVYLIGIGMGKKENMTLEAWQACEEADVLIGASRMLADVKELNKPTHDAYKAPEIMQFLKEHPEYEKAAILFSGDIGFYSGAKRLIEGCKEAGYQCKGISGISSLVYFTGKLGMSWEDAALVSLHGRKNNIVSTVKRNKKTFILLGGEMNGGSLCRHLVEYGLPDVKVYLGESLSYPEEQILAGSALRLSREEGGDLSVALVLNEHADSTYGIGADDEEFIRGKVPMSKSEVRALSVAKLKLTEDAVVYDIGAGTGSVAVEMALMAHKGTVYAIEKNEDGIHLIQENRDKFQAEHLIPVHGSAPEALKDLPVPTHAFIGGSSGNLKEIIAVLLEKNPEIRIVLNCITLETLEEMRSCITECALTDVEIVQVSAAKAKKMGNYHMMIGQNPIFILSCRGGR